MVKIKDINIVDLTPEAKENFKVIIENIRVSAEQKFREGKNLNRIERQITGRLNLMDKTRNIDWSAVSNILWHICAWSIILIPVAIAGFGALSNASATIAFKVGLILFGVAFVGVWVLPNDIDCSDQSMRSDVSWLDT